MKLISCLVWNIPGFDLNNVLRAPSGRNASTSGHVRLCDVIWQLQSHIAVCETCGNFATADFTYGCTWRWCADSWAAAACIRGFSSRGRQTWTMGLFSPGTPAPSTGRTSPCCPGGKMGHIWYEAAVACPDMHSDAIHINQMITPLPGMTCKNS